MMDRFENGARANDKPMMDRFEAEVRLVAMAQDMIDLYRMYAGNDRYLAVSMIDGHIHINNAYMDDDAERPVRVAYNADTHSVTHLDVEPVDEERMDVYMDLTAKCERKDDETDEVDGCVEAEEHE